MKGAKNFFESKVCTQGGCEGVKNFFESKVGMYTRRV